MEWKDTTSYRSGERGAEPREYTTQSGAFRLVVFWMIDKWCMSCDGLFYQYPIYGAKDASQAKEIAASLLRDALKLAIDDLGGYDA